MAGTVNYYGNNALIRTQGACVRKIVYDGILPKKGETLLIKTGAKLTNCGGGWWKLAGYAADKKDITKAVEAIFA